MQFLNSPVALKRNKKNLAPQEKVEMMLLGAPHVFLNCSQVLITILSWWHCKCKWSYDKAITIESCSWIDFIREQFTVKVKAHPALFEGEGRGEQKKWGTVIPVYSWHTPSKLEQNNYSMQSTQLTYTFKTHKNTKTAKASTLCVYFRGICQIYNATEKCDWPNTALGCNHQSICMLSSYSLQWYNTNQLNCRPRLPKSSNHRNIIIRI